MKAYRKRFVLCNMVLIGIVLTAMAAGIAVYMYHDYYNSLHDTMAQVVKPLAALSAETDTADTAAASGGEASSADTGTDTADTGTEPTAPADAEPAAPSGEGIAAPADEGATAPAGADAAPPAETAAAASVTVPKDSAPRTADAAAPSDTGGPQGEDAAPPDGGQPPADSDVPQPSGGAQPVDAPQPPETAPQPDDAPADRSSSQTQPVPRQEGRKDIAAVVYDPESGGTEVLSGAAELDGDTLEEVLPLVAQQEEDFGTLAEYGLIYYRDTSGAASSIALTDTAYIGTSMTGLLLALAGVWLAAMLCFLAVSIWLSGLAARPMEQAAEREKQFVADVSHDLKTPLAVITANNSILLENPETSVGTLRRWVDSTGQAARQMQGLVEEMLTLTAAQRGPDAPPVPVDLSGAVTKAALQLESVAYERQVALETDIAPHITVLGGAEPMQRIASSLIENAIKYEPAGGSVAVSLSAAKRQARLTVHNRGSVIPPEALDHVFDRFYRGDKSRSPVEGHGLGLAIVRQLVENAGGSISIRSSAAEGTAFLVTLPLRDRAAG